MKGRRTRAKVASKPIGALPKPRRGKGETQRLRLRLAEVETQLDSYRNKHQWLQSALAAQRHARQVLEAGVSAGYQDTVARIRQVVGFVVPEGATILVVSKGDQELLQFDRREGWHFPQNDSGVYAGYHPADSSEAISHLKALMVKGGEFLLLPNSAFWWLEHYTELREWLERSNKPVWRDEKCAIYQLAGACCRSQKSDESRSECARPRAQQCSVVEKPTKDKDAQKQAKVAAPEDGHAPAFLKTFALGQADKPDRPDVICFPIIDWDFRFQRPQQLMMRFAAAGHRVFYLSHRFRKSGESYLLRSIGPGLWEVSLRGPRYEVKQGVLDERSREILFQALTELRAGEFSGTAVGIVQAPFWWPLARQAGTVFGWPLVYDCMDCHGGFSDSNPLLVEQELELFAGADLVVTSSAVLQVQACAHAHRVILVRNGCDYDHFAKVPSKPRTERPVIGYYGAIADWFDSDLVADLAKRRPEWDFLLVGSTLKADLSRLSRLPNVSLAGEKPYQEIPDWLAKFDVAILPFKRTLLTEAANPVKAYEIFASGKPLVSVPLPEMTPLEPLARLASTAEQFERAIRAELNGRDRNLERRRRAFARNNGWEKRFQKFHGAIEHLFEEDFFQRGAERTIAASYV